MPVYNPKKYALIVEDSADLRELLKRLYRRAGYWVEFAANGKEALAFLKSSARLPSVIFLDMMMPVMDGFTFREIQKRNQQFAQIPLVIMTACGASEVEKMGFAAKNYIKKPLDIYTLLDVTLKYCSG